MMNQNFEIKQLKEMARGRWLEIIPALAQQLSEACTKPGTHVKCPCHGSRDGFRLFEDANETGGGVCNQTGEFADGFALLQWTNDWSFKQTIQEVSDCLGVDMNCVNQYETKGLPEATQKPEEADKVRERVRATWEASSDETWRIEQYLQHRGLSGKVPESLLFHSNLPYWEKRDGHIVMAGNFHSLIAPIQLGYELIGIHITYLASNHKGKADVASPKKMQKCTESLAGGAVRLFEPEENKPLVLCEGIETGMAIHEATQWPVWACGAAGLLESVSVPDEVRTIYIGADLDPGGKGKESAEKLARRLIEEGKTVHVVLPESSGPNGEKLDWLDVLNGEGVETVKNMFGSANPWSNDKGPNCKDEKIKQGKEVFLKDPEPWPESVDGKELLEELSRVFQDHVSLADGAEIALPLWVLFSWGHEAFQFSPLLIITSPTKGCGKSTLLQVLNKLVPRPLVAANITPAALFRTVEKYQPTLLVDEVDTFLKTNPELTGIINSGHERGGAQTVRLTGDKHEPTIFSTWCPKVLSGIGRLRDTLEDRAIIIEMKRKHSDIRLKRLRNLHKKRTDEIKSKCLKWVKENFKTLQEANPELPDELGDRAQDNWCPLVAIADLIDEEWGKMAREAAVLLSGRRERDDNSVAIQLLMDLRDYFSEQNISRAASRELVSYLNEIENRPWAEFNKGFPIKAVNVGRLLKPFGIRPGTIRINSDTFKGYKLEDCQDAFERYLPTPNETVTTDTSSKDNSLCRFCDVTEISDVTDNGSPKTLENGDVTAVTGQSGGCEVEAEKLEFDL